MKLAEALSIRKDLQVRIAQLGPRIQANVKVQEGDEPSEQPEEMMKELDACFRQVEGLIYSNQLRKLDMEILTLNFQTEFLEV